MVTRAPSGTDPDQSRTATGSPVTLRLKSALPPGSAGSNLTRNILMEDNNRRAALEQRRDRIITLLAKYPGLDDDELADLLHWFKKEASALDVGLIASDPNLKTPYDGLKKDHLDRMRGADLFWMVMLIGGIFVALGLLIWSSI